jgi:hypothetical protein
MSGGIDPGCIRIGLAIADGRVSAVELAGDRPQLSSALRGRKADEAVRLLPLLFAICGKAQGRAAQLALDAARGVAAAPQLDPAIAGEVMREHLWRWLLDLPPLLGEAPLKTEFAAALNWVARAQRDHLAELLAGPRIADLTRHLEVAVRAAVGAEASPVAMLPGLDAATSLRHWPRLDASFSRLPQWQGAAAETGALARRGGAAAPSLALRWMARRAEVDDWAQGRAKVGAGGTASAASVAPGVGRALVETARGLLMHEVELDGERIANYVIVAPTEWNFHPQGPLAAWLAGSDATDLAALQARVALAVATLDPCVRWELAWL